MDVETITIEPGDPREPGVARLLREAEEYSQALYPPESIHMLPVDELDSPEVHFLVARRDDTGEVLGCGAFVLRDGRGAELKRMFTDTATRRRGVGSRLLRALEDLARSVGAGVMRLETGTGQPEAVALYRRSGYRERGPFGDYREDPLSIFMEKSLDVV